MAAEEASLTGRFRRVVDFYEHWLRFALERPKWMAIFAIAVDRGVSSCVPVAGY